MNSIIDFVMQNYLIILIVSILILLAIIGYLVEQTNLYKNESSNKIIKDKKIEIKNDSKNDKDIELNIQSDISKELNNFKLDNNQIETLTYNQTKNEEQLKKLKEFENFEKEFNSIVPKKEVVDSDLLTDIENLSLDKTQKFKFSDIPDLDNVDLPKIDGLKTDDVDIWRF